MFVFISFLQKNKTIIFWFNSSFRPLNRWVHDNSLWLIRRRCRILFKSVFSHSDIISCLSLSLMQIPFDLGNEFTMTFGSSHKRARTQAVNGKKKERRRRKEKEKGKILTTTKKLIKLVNSPAAAPKT